MTQDDQSGLDWRGAIPVSRRFDDPYFSLAGGLEETRHVFLAGNDLPRRLRPGFHVAETGFGTGLNLLALARVATVPDRGVGSSPWRSTSSSSAVRGGRPESAEAAMAPSRGPPTIRTPTAGGTAQRSAGLRSKMLMGP